MNCRKCNTPYEPTPSLYQMESRNKLFCFEDVPALKCPECEHLFIPEPTVKIILEQIATLSQGSPIPYIKYKWNKKTNIQTPDELADELFKKGGSSDSEELEDEAGMEPTPPMEQIDESRTVPEQAKQSTPEVAPKADVEVDVEPRSQAKSETSSSKAASTASKADKSGAATINTTRTKGVVVRKRSRVKTGTAA